VTGEIEIIDTQLAYDESELNRLKTSAEGSYELYRVATAFKSLD
jgi:hypothetical protein